MTARDEEPRRVLLLGLEDVLLWQLTRSLVQAEPGIEYHCALDFSAARELCGRTFFDYIVVDGWMQPWQASYAMGPEEVARMDPRKWIVLVDSLPMGGLLDEPMPASVVFLEKPFNPKEFPAFLRNLETDRSPRADGREGRTGAGAGPAPPVEPGERYRTQGLREPGAAAGARPAPGTADGGPEDAFHACLEQGFVCLGRGDAEGARCQWERARELRPGDGRVAANLRRLARAKS